MCPAVNLRLTGCAAYAVQVYSFVFANSGTLLLCFVDVTGLLASFRQHCKATFPGQRGSTPADFWCCHQRCFKPLI